MRLIKKRLGISLLVTLLMFSLAFTGCTQSGSTTQTSSVAAISSSVISSQSSEQSTASVEAQPKAETVAPSTQIVPSAPAVVSSVKSVSLKPVAPKPSTPKVSTPSKQVEAVETPSETPQTPQGVAVFITKTGKKYHVDGCQYLRQSKIEISLGDAKAEGYTPCSKCHPPE